LGSIGRGVGTGGQGVHVPPLVEEGQGILYHTKWWGIFPPAPLVVPPALNEMKMPHQCSPFGDEQTGTLLYVSNY